MIKKFSGIILPFILLFTFLAKADVPPPAGQVRSEIDLVTETTEELSDYRFFLDFYGDLREVEIKSKGRTEIPPMGGGARYGSGTLLAIPKSSLSAFEGKLSNEQAEKLSSAIKNKEIAGVVELVKHRFIMDVPRGDKPPEVFYVITREEDTLKAERLAKEAPPSIFANSRTGLIVGGILISLAVLCAGIFAFRKAAKKV